MRWTPKYFSKYNPDVTFWSSTFTIVFKILFFKNQLNVQFSPGRQISHADLFRRAPVRSPGLKTKFTSEIIFIIARIQFRASNCQNLYCMFVFNKEFVVNFGFYFEMFEIFWQGLARQSDRDFELLRRQQVHGRFERRRDIRTLLFSIFE